MPPTDPQNRQQLSLPPLAWAVLFGAGLMLVLLVAGIAAQLVILKDSRDHIRAQDAKLALALSSAREIAPEARRAAKQVQPVTRAIGPLGRKSSELATATEGLPRLVRTSQAVAAAALPVLADVGRVDVAHVLSTLHDLAGSALYRARLARALDTTSEILDQVRREDLIRLSARTARNAPRLMRLTRRLMRVQIESLKTQRLQLQTQIVTLDVQREALVHIRSIDRKTGGTAPPTPTPTAPAPAP